MQGLNRAAEAIVHYRHALELEPQSADLLNSLAVMLLKTGRPQEALGYLREEMRLRPDSASGYANAAQAYASLGRTADAISSAEKAFDLARSSGQTDTAEQIAKWLVSYRERTGQP